MTARRRRSAAGRTRDEPSLRKRAAVETASVEGVTAETVDADPVEPTYLGRAPEPTPTARMRSEALFQSLVMRHVILPSDGVETVRLARVYRTLARYGAVTAPAPRVYRSHEIQTATMPDGRVLVSSELFEHDPSDDTLAFVLAHELSHHELGHLRPLYENDAVIEGLPGSGAVERLVRALRLHVHSEDHELDADRRALDRIRDAGYADEGAIAFFSDLPAAPLRPGDSEPSRAMRVERLTAIIDARRSDRVAWASPTDRCFLCVPCELRHRGATCPDCHRASLDLRAESGRDAALASLTARRRYPRDAGRASVRDALLIGAGILGAAMIGTVAPDHLFGGVAVLGAALLTAWGLSGGLGRIRRDLRRITGLRTHHAPIRLSNTSVPVLATLSVSGPTQDALLRAPLSGRPCIAWRVVGQSPHGLIDDAASGPFVVRDPAYGEVAIPAAPAHIRFGNATSSSRSFARATLAHPYPWALTRECTHVTETIIEAGQTVRVSGRGTARSEPAGYRSVSRHHVAWDEDTELEIVA